MEREPVLTPSQEDEHVLHMWEPLSFSVDEDYDYRRQGFFCRLGTGLLRIVVFVLLSVYNYVTLGMKIDGRENLKALRGRGAVTVCNHVHPMDCTMIDLAVFPRRIHYVTLDTNFRIPLVRHLIRWLGAVPLSRSPHQIARLFEAMGAAMDDGVLVQVYPEGVLIPYAPKLRKCKGGAFRLAADYGAPVVPMVITQEPPTGLFRLYKKKPCLHLHILPALEPDPTLPPRAAANLLRERCVQAMEARLASSQITD